MLDNLQQLDELALPGVVRKQKSITRLFPDFPAKVRGVANKGGLRLRNIEPDRWHFKIHSGTEDDLWYDAYIYFKDIDRYLNAAVRDRKILTKSKEQFDLRKLAKKMLYHVDMQLSCSCPAF